MHELALMDDLVATIGRELDGEHVAVVRLEVGERSCASPSALQFCFDVCVRGTALEGATLDIVRAGGEVLRLREIEVE